MRCVTSVIERGREASGMCGLVSLKCRTKNLQVPQLRLQPCFLKSGMPRNPEPQVQTAGCLTRRHISDAGVEWGFQHRHQHSRAGLSIFLDRQKIPNTNVPRSLLRINRPNPNTPQLATGQFIYLPPFWTSRRPTGRFNV